MTLIYILDHVATSLAGNYNVKMVVCYNTMNFRIDKMYHTCKTYH